MRKLLLFLIISGFYTGVSAQKLGYIRTDSSYISCDVYPQKEAKSFKICYYRLYPPATIETATPYQILGYGYGKTDFCTFTIKTGNDSVKKFLQAIVQGDSPVYYLSEKSGNHFYILNRGKELVELKEENGEFKYQLAEYFGAPSDIVAQIHNGFTRQGIERTVKILKEANLQVIQSNYENQEPAYKGKSLSQVRKLQSEKPLLSLSFQSGVTIQRLPIELQEGLPAEWDKFKSSSITYSLAADVPLFRYYPLSYHQEICFNKFVNDYKQGADPPDYQLIQDYSVISLPAMLGYTIGKKKLTFILTAGVQIDIALQENNIGFLITGEGGNILPGNEFVAGYYTYTTIRPGFTAGLGLNYKINSKFVVTSVIRYSRINNLLPGIVGVESLYAINAGISYCISKKEK
jgi:opacity protein-like surface antigen